jgi:hypothetical protein
MFFVFTLGVVVGLVVAWNVWPQPVWAKGLYHKTLGHLYEKKAP